MMNSPSSLIALPTEILQEVFYQCLPSSLSDTDHPVVMRTETRTSSEHAPLLLCNVCKRWRDITLSSPNLWTTISVIVRLGSAVPAPHLVSLWLSRSGALPLNLALYQQNESNANCIAAGRILDIFIRCISHWGDVRLELFGPCYARSPIIGEIAASSLRYFQLHTSHNFSEEEEKDFFSIFYHVPQLRSLRISRVPYLNLSGVSPISIPWRQLVHLSLDYVPSVGAALGILSMCPNLESCDMKVDTARGSLFYNPLQLPQLRLLSINLGFESLGGFLDYLILPRLIELTVFVRGPLEHYRWAQEQFDAFLTRSHCQIRRLEIHNTGLTSLEFVACLQHPNLQALIELVIDDMKGWTWDPFITPAALDLLMIHDLHHMHRTSPLARDKPLDIVGRTSCFLPLLGRLTVRGNCFLSPDGAIADMLESRWRSYGEEVARLNRVEIELPMNHTEDARRLKELQGEGLEVVLSQQY